MSPNSQRAICRFAVVTLGVLPTLLIAGWIGLEASARVSLASRDEWQRTLSARTGLAVTVGGVQYPHPRLALLRDIKLADRRTGQSLGEVAAVEVAAAGQGWSVELVQPVLESRQMGPALAALEEYLRRCRSENAAPPGGGQIRAAAKNLLLRQEAESLSLSDVTAEIGAAPAAITFEARFQWAGEAGPRPMHLAAHLRQTEREPHTEWRLDTADSVLPCRLLAPLWPPIARLGAACGFAGAAEWAWLPEGVSGQLRGQLQLVDLDALVSEQFPHRLSGRAEILVEQATLAEGRLMELRGVLRAAEGTASASLVAAAAEHLQLAPAPEIATLSPGAAIAFDRLAVRFDLARESLALASSEEVPAAGTLVSSAGRPLLAAPAGHTVPVVHLVRTLVPDSRYQVPATRQTAALVGWLPAPAVQPAAPPRAAAAHHPVRLAPAEPHTGSPAIRQPVLR